MRLFLREAGLPTSTLTTAEHQPLLEELEAGLAARQPRMSGYISASTALVYIRGECFAFYGGNDDARRSRDLRRQQLVALWADVRGHVWQAMIDGKLPVAILLEDGRLETPCPAALKLNVESEVFDQGTVVWPKAGLLVVAEPAVKRWVRGSSKRGATSSPTDTPVAVDSLTAPKDIGAGAADRPIDHPKRRPGPKPGTVRRWAAKDRKLFPAIKALLDEKRSLTGATLDLAMQGKVAGTGSNESRARRLYIQYKRERLDPTRSH
jgi:hypothetical protein